MKAVSSKNFGPIRDDYTFFEEHATEAAQDLLAYAPYLPSLTIESGPIRMLDFGCGAGEFTAQFLTLTRLSQERLWLSLVEPEEMYRQQAVERLQAFTTHLVGAWPALPSSMDACFDLVLANHVFYYVRNLNEVLSGILRSLATPGIFLTAIAGQRNTLIQFCYHCFGLIGKPFPFHTAEDLEVALAHLGEIYHKQDVQYDLVFPDSEENRLKILRFVLGDYFHEVPRQPMLDLFNVYAHADQIVIQTVHKQFIIQRQRERLESFGSRAFF